MEPQRRAGGADTVYDDIFVYGLENVYQPLTGLPGQHRFADKVRYMGYLKRAVPSPMPPNRYPRITKQPFVLVTPGGGGDGAARDRLGDLGLRGRPDHRTARPHRLRPLHVAREAQGIRGRIARNPKLEGLGFEPRPQLLMNRAHCVVAMGGYNTFCGFSPSISPP